MRSASPIFRAVRLTVEVTHFGTVSRCGHSFWVSWVPALGGIQGVSCLLCTERDSARSISAD